MDTFGRGTYGNGSSQTGGTFPVWKYIDNEGTEDGGGNFKVISDFAAEYPAGMVIPIGTPVKLVDGVLTIMKAYELAADILAADTVVKFKIAGVAYPLKTGINLMAAPLTVATTGTGIAVGTVAVVGENYEVTIVADSWGHTAKAGDIFVEASGAGASKTIAVVPTGLTRRAVAIVAGTQVATGASVFHGAIYGDRIAPTPACVKAVLPMIKFIGG